MLYSLEQVGFRQPSPTLPEDNVYSGKSDSLKSLITYPIIGKNQLTGSQPESHVICERKSKQKTTG